MTPDITKLIHHISRLEGQLAAIKMELKAKEPNCEKTALTLKAASRSFASLRMNFVACFLEYMSRTKKTKDEVAYQALLQVING